MNGNNIAVARKINPNLIEIQFLQENKSLNLSEVKYGWDLAANLDPEKSCCILLKTGPWTLLEKEAGEYAFTEMKSWPAVAIIVHSSAQRILGTVGISIIGQRQKMKVFTQEKSALAWLEEMMNLA